MFEGLSITKSDGVNERRATAVMSINSRFSPSLYTSRMLARMLLEIWLLALFIEAIYLSERSISVLRMILDQPIGMSNFVRLLAWTAPEVYLALPIAVLIAVYRTILRCRERREFIALASSGQSTLPLMRSTAVVALLAFLSSLAISGAVFPLAKFAFRHDTDNLRYQALRAGGSPGQFLYLPNYTIYLFPSNKRQLKRPVFVKQIVDGGKFRIVNADQTDLIDGSQPGSMTIRMFGVTIHNFPNVNEPWIDTEPERTIDARNLFCNHCDDGVTGLQTISLVKELGISNLIRFEPRGATLDEWLMPELLGFAAPPDGGGRPGAKAEAVRRLSRSLLGFLAPFLAWLTLSFTVRRSWAVALPLACICLMVADIGFSQLISVLGPDHTIIALVAIILLTCAAVALMIREIIVRQHLVVSPSLARS
jgi:lipopolysaccharide export LptBFGC system permease protein LptF